MPRALTIHRTIVPQQDRTQYLARARARRDHYARSKCNFWVFEEAGLPGAFIEFTEAPDRASLAAAHAAAPPSAVDAARVYVEVELEKVK